jgi:ubiquinone biosynthesis protein
MQLAAYFRLLRAGFILAREGALSIADNAALPPVMRAGIRLGRLFERPEVRRTGRVDRLTRALNRLGPTYVKFGQTLATRPDIVGPEIAADLSVLQDKMAPFDAALVPAILKSALGERAKDLVELSAPVAAASIAQVHRAVLVENGTRRDVAVKILRPGVPERFAADLEAYRAGAGLAERFAPALRRLRPLDMVATLERSARIELDLRLEAAAISQLGDNLKDDRGFVIPEVMWSHMAENVLTTSWVSGIPLNDLAALDAAGVNRKTLAANLLQSFLRQAVRDGYFHADLHPGNLFADPATSDIIAVDFGIMGRLTRKERRFLADVVYGFIKGDYMMIAKRHFDIGYVPQDQSVDEFALALRAIGAPLQGRRASEISMANVLGQLFTTTELFQMRARPELILLQKSMVLVEGVARSLDPDLDIWTLSEPVVSAWLKQAAGPLGRLEDLKEHLDVATATLGRLPVLADKAEALMDAEQLRRSRLTPWQFWTRTMIVVGFALVCATLLIAIVRLLVVTSS